VSGKKKLSKPSLGKPMEEGGDPNIKVGYTAKPIQSGQVTSL
jgi:hypothetical protein